jgi:hypothetical protein
LRVVDGVDYYVTSLETIEINPNSNLKEEPYMKKSQGRAQLANAARAAGLTLRFSSVGGAEKVTALNSSKIVVSTCSIRAVGESYNTQDVVSATKVLNSSRQGRKRMNSARDARRARLNCSEDTDFEGDDADFVEDVDNVVVDEEGNAVDVDEMLIVQDPETNEISLFIPDNESDDVPENLNVIGEVISADAVDLDSSRKRLRRMNSSKLNASGDGDDLTAYELEKCMDTLDSIKEAGDYDELQEAISGCEFDALCEDLQSKYDDCLDSGLGFGSCVKKLSAIVSRYLH